MQIYYLALYFFTYGLLGWCTEVAFAAVKEKAFVNRGFLNGPICPIYGVGVSAVLWFLTPLSGNLPVLYIASTVLVTVLEGLTGYFMDRIFHHKWWDYTGQPLNIGGYVCLIFSLVWGAACVIIVRVIHPIIHEALSVIPFMLGIVLLIPLAVVLFADLYVTSSSILKFNRQLEAMDKIAGELRELSDKLGETIYENVMETMEIKEEGKKRLEERIEEPRERLEEYGEELKKRYEELAGQRGRIVRRLVSAFPKMESRHHKEILEELKIKLRDRF